MNPDGSGLERYAWGVRSPFGLRWGPGNQLFCSDNGYDERGSRPIANAKDNVYVVQQNGWYGFPDFSSGIPVTDRQFHSSRGPKPKFLLKNHPPVEKPLFTRPSHAALTKFDFSRSERFGFVGQMFLGEAGSGTPVSAPGRIPTGYQVVKVDLRTLEAEPFFRTKNSALGPTGYENVVTAGLKRPTAVRFSPDGSAMYVADFGAIASFVAGPGPLVHPYPGTGVIWRISRGATNNVIPSGLSPLRARSEPERRPE